MREKQRKDAIAKKGRELSHARWSLWRRILNASPFVAGGILLTLLYGNTALFRQLETTALDIQMLLRQPPDTSDVVVVRITDADYQSLFHGKSPLDPATLQNLIGAIASGKPKVIGVDLDTSAKDFQMLKPLPGWPPVIWARNATYSNISRKYILSDALGGNNPYAQSGLVTLKVDADGVARRYVRWYDTDAGPMPSLPVAILGVFGNGGGNVNPSDLNEDFLISYSGAAKYSHLLEPKASQVLEMSAQENWANKNLLKDKIVLLGGDYAVQDEHATPTGWMLGAEILASIIETERGGGGRQPLGRVTIILLAIVDSVVLLILIHVWGLRNTVLISILLIPTLAVVCSLLAFGSAAYVGYYILILSAVLLHQVYEKGKDYYKSIKERAAKEIK